MNEFTRLGSFFKKHPALWLGTSMLVLLALYFTKTPVFYIPYILLMATFLGVKYGFIGTIVTVFLLNTLPSPASPPLEEVVNGVFYPHNVKERKTSFGPKWEYVGTLTLENQTQFPIKLTLPAKPFKTRPRADYTYRLKGIFKEGLSAPFFIPLKNTHWQPIQPITLSLSEWRYAAKNNLRKQIQQRFSSDKSVRFLEGISTGEFQDRIMAKEFGRFGLQHIMAVSGFHFAIITGILSWLCCTILGQRRGASVLLAALFTYFLFLGGAPSITRAWIAASLLMIGILTNRGVKSLNSLGLGLLAVLAFEPRAIFQLGFQFSFVITASILILTKPFEELLTKIFPARRLTEANAMTRIEQLCYVALQWLRKAAAMSFAVNASALPMTLAIFGKFPLWSLFFNLFFPLMVSLAMFLLIIGLTVGVFLEQFGIEPSYLNNWYTDFILNLAYNFPYNWDVVLEMEPISTNVMVIYLTALFAVGSLVHTREEKLTPDAG